MSESKPGGWPDRPGYASRSVSGSPRPLSEREGTAPAQHVLESLMGERNMCAYLPRGDEEVVKSKLREIKQRLVLHGSYVREPRTTCHASRAGQLNLRIG